jgi:hypothetical protein
VALFGPDAPGRRCPLIGEEQKFAARCQCDANDPKQTFEERCLLNDYLKQSVSLAPDLSFRAPWPAAFRGLRVPSQTRFMRD